MRKGFDGNNMAEVEKGWQGDTEVTHVQYGCWT